MAGLRAGLKQVSPAIQPITLFSQGWMQGCIFRFLILITAVQGQLLTFFKATFKQKNIYVMFCLLWTKHKITVILDKSHHSSFPKSIKLAHFTNIRWRITHDKWQIWKYQGKQKNVKGYLLNWATLPLSTLWPGKKIIIYPTCIMHFYFNSLACVSVILFLIFSSDG